MNKTTAQIINYLEKNFKVEKMGECLGHANIYNGKRFVFSVEIEPWANNSNKIWIGWRFVFSDDTEAYNKAIKLINQGL